RARLPLAEDRRSRTASGVPLDRAAGARARLALHAGLLPAMAHAPEPRPDAIRRARSGRARRAAQLAGGQSRALTSRAPQGRPQTHRACRGRTTPGAQLPYPARRPRHAHPQCRPPRARSPHRRSRHPHPDPAPRPRSARRYPHRVDRPHPPGLTISTACAQKRVKFGLRWRDGISRRYIRRLIGLAFLSPQLIETILQGRQPVALTATRLTELDLPLDWTEQQKLLAS